MKRIWAVFTLASILIPSLAQAGDRAPEAAGQTVVSSHHGFPRVALDQSRVVKKRLRTLLNRQCNCKQRCDATSGFCMIGTSADACSPGEFWPEPCADCVSTRCS